MGDWRMTAAEITAAYPNRWVSIESYSVWLWEYVG